MKKRGGCLFFFLVLQSTSLWGEEFIIPVENQQQDQRASIQNFDDKARRLLVAIGEGRFESVRDLFFPEPAFLQLKAIAKPLDYYRQLTTWYQNDFKKEVERFKGRGPLQFKALRGGSCQWKAAQSEANKIPYWSCYKKKIDVQTVDNIETIEIRALINWGSEWYITHLGPIPKP